MCHLTGPPSCRVYTYVENIVHSPPSLVPFPCLVQAQFVGYSGGWLVDCHWHVCACVSVMARLKAFIPTDFRKFICGKNEMGCGGSRFWKELRHPVRELWKASSGGVCELAEVKEGILVEYSPFFCLSFHLFCLLPVSTHDSSTPFFVDRSSESQVCLQSIPAYPTRPPPPAPSRADLSVDLQSYFRYNLNFRMFVVSGAISDYSK